MKKLILVTAKLAFGVAAILLAVGYFGANVPLFDSLSLGRPLLLIAMLPLAFIFPIKPRIMIIVYLAFLAVYTLWKPAQTLPEKKEDQFTLYQHNLLYTNPAVDLPMVIARFTPDVITLQEISTAENRVRNLKEYPYQSICKFNAIGDVGVLSRHPIIDQGCSNGLYRGFAWARIKRYDGAETTVVSLHTHWPYPFGQSKQIEEWLPQLEELNGPIVVAGDFNQSPWSATVNQIEDATQTEILGGLRLTLVRKPLALPIDHVLAPSKAIAQITKLDRYGSDHNALFVRFAKWPSQ